MVQYLIDARVHPTTMDCAFVVQASAFHCSLCKLRYHSPPTRLTVLAPMFSIVPLAFPVHSHRFKAGPLTIRSSVDVMLGKRLRFNWTTLHVYLLDR